MKKIHSFLLMALTLLISTYVGAVTPISSKADLLTYFNEKSGNGSVYDLQLTTNIEVDETLYLYAKENDEGNTINLDLNGNTLTFTKITGIELFKGELNIIGSGYVASGYTGKGTSYVIMVYGYNDENTSE